VRERPGAVGCFRAQPEQGTDVGPAKARSGRTDRQTDGERDEREGDRWSRSETEGEIGRGSERQKGVGGEGWWGERERESERQRDRERERERERLNQMYTRWGGGVGGW